MSRRIVMIIGLTLFTGCGPRLKEAMATALACPEEIELTPGRYLTASGCGRTMFYVRANNGWVSPLSRASFDMSCAEADMTVTPVDATTVGVEGCGKKAAYVAGRDAHGGRWILNAASEVPADGKPVP